MPQVNPQILQWARETAELSLDEAARKIGLATSRASSREEKLLQLERGDTEPTQVRLMKMADVYHRPLITFYMAEPPVKDERGGDFRKLPPDFSREQNALLDALLRDIKARQEMVRELMEDEDEALPLEYVGSLSRKNEVQEVAEAIKERLDLSLEELRRCRNKEAVFKLLRERAESIGVFVLLMGDLGSHHTDIGTDVFRGFAIADTVAPFIVINDNDSQGAWSFTLLHELAHLWIGEEGVSNSSAWADSQIEKFCNNVAGEILLPDKQLHGVNVNASMEVKAIAHVINGVSGTTKLSHTLIAYNLYRVGKIDLRQYQELSREYRRLWSNNKQGQQRSGGGPNYYVVKRHRIGAAMTNLIGRMLKGGAVTPTKAAKILGVKAHSVNQLVGGAKG
ncbi:MAG: XRE family transcriptional regulator [Pseudomonadota bacterium]